MTRILHTADVHLHPDDERRLDGLQAVLDLARERSVDAVTIGGDLFDRPQDVETLRTTLRNEFFSDVPFDIILIPGNHDIEAYRQDIHFGDDCETYTTKPFDDWVSPEDDLRITCLPYHEKATDELLLALADRSEFDGTEALMLHCSLEAPFASYETGEEDAHRYFPVTEGVLEDLGFDYYLAGHYHSFHEVSLANDAVFTYPGTPVSVKSSETGPRRVCLLDTETGLTFERLETFHYARESFTVMPGEEASCLDAIDAWVDRNVHESTEATVEVHGFVDMAEDTFATQVREAAGDASVENETRGVERLRRHPLYVAFEDHLAEIGNEWDESTRKAVRERTLEVMVELAAKGEV